MTFERLGLHKDLLKAIEKKGFTAPTPIQKSCIPLIKAGKDVVGQSLTGSGKTAAFGLPMIERVHPGQGIQALILVPTRELAVQVSIAIASFSAFTPIKVIPIYGGAGMQPQIEGLRTADIVVATPGRMLDHIRHRTSNLSKVKILVLDEADKMLEMGFIDDVRAIMSHLPQERQSLLFGATIPSELMGLIRRHLKNPNFVREEIYVDKNLLRQSYYNLKQQDKFSLLVHLLKHKTSGLAIVFCATRKRVDFLSRNLAKNGIHVRAVHGGLSQSKRFYAVESLKKEKTDVLVATDVAARGLDINNITHIYNYDSAKNSTEYIHRIGRTARAGKSGEAITILSERDHDNFRNVVSDRSLNIRKGELPCFDRISMPREEERFRGRRHDNRGRDSSGSRFRGAAGGRRGGFRPRRH